MEIVFYLGPVVPITG